MSRHDDRICMRQMRDYVRRAHEMASGRSRADLVSDHMFELALTRLVEIIGEAATRVSLSTRKKHEQIPWADIVGMRNRLIHGYDMVDLDLLWGTVEIDLPSLIAALDNIIDG